MSLPVTQTLFDSGASPQTGVGDANSTAYTAWNSDSAEDGPITVLVTATGTWNSVTLKFEVTAAESPERWVKAQVMDPSAGTLTDASMTASGSIMLTVPQGAKLRGVISGSGSPLPALVVKAFGQIA